MHITAFVSCVKKERKEFGIGVSNLRPGQLVSLSNGRLVSFAPDQEFAGVLEAHGENIRGQAIAAVVVRGAASVRVNDLTRFSRQGDPVYAVLVPNGESILTANENAGGVCVGELLDFESDQRAIVGFRVASDKRRYFSGSRAAGRGIPQGVH